MGGGYCCAHPLPPDTAECPFVLLYTLVSLWRGGHDPGSGNVVPKHSLLMRLYSLVVTLYSLVRTVGRSGGSYWYCCSPSPPLDTAAFLRGLVQLRPITPSPFCCILSF